MELDLDFVRAQFPALAGDWVFFDNAGGSQVLGTVAGRIREYLLTTSVQIGASYEPSQIVQQRVDDARRAMATYVNAAHDSEIIMGPSTTMLLRNLSHSLARTLVPGDEVIVTNCDHEANVGPWVNLAERGVTVKTWRLREDSYSLDPEDLRSLLTSRTRLVAVTHASNVLGSINPVREYARIAHEHGARICVDGVAFAPHRRIDVQALDVDFYAFSFYKTYGPHYALLYGKREHLLRLPGINHFFIGEDDVPYKFQPGSVNYELSWGMLGLWDYLEAFARAHGRADLEGDRGGQIAFAFDTIARHEERLSTRFLGFLAQRPGVRVIGSTPPDRARRVPTFSFVVEGRESDTITREVDRHGIGIRFGHFYAARLIHDLGLDRQNGAVRVSMVHYNTQAEVDRLVDVLDHII